MEHSLHVIGTAGHVDHGKSTLVKALTGIDPDRLAEEKARQMTIDLGFAWMELGEKEIGIVDVPGHRDFIENMLAGVGSIDLALFVIAADEGVMPQTREHLAILDLLQIQHGIVALTKIDLIDDPEWLDLVALDVADALAGTVLQDAPIVPVSAFTGAGLDALKALIEERLALTGAQPDGGRPRLAVDRVFSLTGFGTVVTGTLTGGSIKLGDQLQVVPTYQKVRVRGLQTHKQELDIARPGSRVAINLTGVDRDDVLRGQVIAAPGAISETLLIDVSYRHLPDSTDMMKHNMQVKLFLGAAEVNARTRLIGTRQLEPGAEGFLQLALGAPIAAAAGDRFILRRPSPPATLGGGVVLDPHPGRRHRRFHQEVIGRFDTLAGGSSADVLLLELQRHQPLAPSELQRRTGLDLDDFEVLLASLEDQGAIQQVAGQVVSVVYWQNLRDKLLDLLQNYHERSPLRLGMPREELRSRLGLSSALFAALTADGLQQGSVAEEGTTLRLSSHQITFSAKQEAQIAAELNRFRKEGVNTPSVKETKTALGEDLYYALLDLGSLIQLSAEVVYEQNQYLSIRQNIIDFLQRNGQIDAAQARDLLQTSRKYAIAILEHLDDAKVTKRVDDARVLT